MSSKGDYNFEAPQFIGCLLSPNDLNDGADNFFDAENSDKAKVSQTVEEEVAKDVQNVSIESKDSGTSVSCDTGSTTSVNTVTEVCDDENKTLRSGKKVGRDSVAPPKTIKNTSPKKKFLSLAEQVHRFHHGTPPRFKQQKPGPIKSRGNKMLPTIGQSPLLQTKTRSRPSTVVPPIVSEERPFLKPVRRTSPKPPPRPASKPVTVPQPFNLTSTNRYKKTAADLEAEKNTKENMNTRTPQKPANIKKKVLEVENGKVVLKEDWAISGIKTIDKVNKTTKFVPFSFEERNQNFLKAKQRKLEEAREKTIEEAKSLAKKSFRPSLAVVNKK